MTTKTYLIASIHSSRSFSLSTWNVRSITFVHCNPRMMNVNGFGRSMAIIWHPLTVKLLSRSPAAFISGFDLNPISVPSSRSTKYRDRQFLMCSPRLYSHPSFTMDACGPNNSLVAIIINYVLFILCFASVVRCISRWGWGRECFDEKLFPVEQRPTFVN